MKDKSETIFNIHICHLNIGIKTLLSFVFGRIQFQMDIKKNRICFVPSLFKIELDTFWGLMVELLGVKFHLGRNGFYINHSYHVFK